MRSASPHSRGFSLVEITLALGVAAVALVSVLGLLGVAANSNRTAGRDTTMVSMSHQVLADLRAADFDALWLAEPRNEDGTTKLVKPANSANAAEPEDSIYYFTAEGMRVPAAEAESNPETAYRCMVRKLPDQATRMVNDGSFNLLQLELAFISPVSAAPTVTRQRTLVHASFARY